MRVKSDKWATAVETCVQARNLKAFLIGEEDEKLFQALMRQANWYIIYIVIAILIYSIVMCLLIFKRKTSMKSLPICYQIQGIDFSTRYICILYSL